MRVAIRAVLVGCGVFWLTACGGNASGDAGNGGAGQGGQVGVGQGGQVGAGGSSSPASGGKAAAGTPGSGGATGGCCLAAPICDQGDTQVSQCPANSTCYERSICCSTILCARQTAQCDGIPDCDPGDKQITGECPPSLGCYTRTLCGTTINCIDSACDPDTEYNRHYVARSRESCALIDFACSAETSYFGNDCGCGCEQDPSCPQTVNCQPRSDGVELSPLCADKLSCPFTQRLW
ncbi:MAG: hypothetical protein QM756_04440 [Polyangiaceae bacterium]